MRSQRSDQRTRAVHYNSQNGDQFFIMTMHTSQIQPGLNHNCCQTGRVVLGAYMISSDSRPRKSSAGLLPFPSDFHISSNDSLTVWHCLILGFLRGDTADMVALDGGSALAATSMLTRISTLADVLDIFRNLRISAYFTAASGVVLLYDHLLTLPDGMFFIPRPVLCSRNH